MMNNNKQHTEHDNLGIINEIKIGLEKVDRTYQTNTPNLHWFEIMISKEKVIARKKLMKELVIFFIVAISVVSLLIITVLQAPIIFLIVQLAVTIGLPMGVYLQHRKRVIAT
ncbi:YxlC family protein [Cytobacillus sp. S13-E01]|uniref:YxlC family protein n=1 Tax=Cytobacillus sp. S13-E01 TaxID=3031326 RepID=UPI0023D7CE8D|nr:YxlC family protein [Cytobacillus sp. S13-E01]MDF0726854.1 YxlC family protein [Cytobacillus sp. S13-E01]